MKTRPYRHAIASALLLCLLAFCNRSEKPEAATAGGSRETAERARYGDSLVVGIPADADTLTPSSQKQ